MMLHSEKAFDRVYKGSRRLFTSPWIFAGMALVMGLLALIVTLGAILQPVPAFTRVTLIVMAVVLWIFAGLLFNWWRKWKVVSTWTQDRIRDREVFERKAERIEAYLAKVDAGELPEEPIPQEIHQDFRDMLAAYRRELLRQEGLY